MGKGDSSECVLVCVNRVLKVAMARFVITGKIVFGEVIPAALAFDGSQYFNQSWRHAAGYVVSPPLRLDSTTSDYLADLLAK